MKDVINVKWAGDMAFEATVDDHRLMFDARQESGGKDKGPRPKTLLMASLGGCTGMDVVSILRKMKVDVTGFNVKVEGDLTEVHPKYFTSMHIIYEFAGENLPLDKITHAIDLSLEKYCGVSATLKKSLPITYEISLNKI